MTDPEFVLAWTDAYKAKTGLKSMCEKYGLAYTDVSQRASRLRRAGVKLPTMPRPNQKHNGLEVDVERLNKIIVHELGEQSLGWRNR